MLDRKHTLRRAGVTVATVGDRGVACSRAAASDTGPSNESERAAARGPRREEDPRPDAPVLLDRGRHRRRRARRGRSTSRCASGRSPAKSACRSRRTATPRSRSAGRSSPRSSSRSWRVLHRRDDLRPRARSRPEKMSSRDGHRAPVVVAVHLRQRRRDRERDAHPGQHAGVPDAAGPPKCTAPCYGDGVIHSFWVPELNGKKDVVPGRTPVPHDRGEPARNVPRPVRRVLRPLPRQHAVARDRPDAGPTTTPGSRASWCGKPKAELLKGVNSAQWGCASCHSFEPKVAGAVGPNLAHVADRKGSRATSTRPTSRTCGSGSTTRPRRKPMGNLEQHMPAFKDRGHDAGRSQTDRVLLADADQDRLDRNSGRGPGECVANDDRRRRRRVRRCPVARREVCRAAARDDGAVELGHHGRPQEDRDHVRHARAHVLRGRRASRRCSSGCSSRRRTERCSPPRVTTSSSRCTAPRWCSSRACRIAAAFGNYLVPLMIGARDVAFPRLNMLGFWIFAFGGMFLYSSFLLGGAPDGGWFGYAPLTSTPLAAGIPAGPRSRLLGRRLDHARHRIGRDRGQLPRHDPQHARARHDDDAACRCSSG